MKRSKGCRIMYRYAAHCAPAWESQWWQCKLCPLFLSATRLLSNTHSHANMCMSTNVRSTIVMSTILMSTVSHKHGNQCSNSFPQTATDCHARDKLASRCLLFCMVHTSREGDTEDVRSSPCFFEHHGSNCRVNSTRYRHCHWATGPLL